MDRISHKLHNAALRRGRVRATISGTAAKPRLSVHISNHHVTAQLVDDEQHKTLAYATSVGDKTAANGTMTEKSERVGQAIAKKAQAAKITTVVFDRGPKLYHGRVKALAEAARKGGLTF